MTSKQANRAHQYINTALLGIVLGVGVGDLPELYLVAISVASLAICAAGIYGAYSHMVGKRSGGVEADV